MTNTMKKRKTNHPPQIQKRRVNGRRKRALQRIEQALAGVGNLTNYQMSAIGIAELTKQAETLRERIR